MGNLPGFTNAGKWDGIILKLNLSDGAIVASNQWGNEGIDGYGNIVEDDNGNFFVSAQGSPVGAGGTDNVYMVAKHKKSDLSNVWRALSVPNTTGFIASSEAWGGLTYMPKTIPGDGKLVVAGWYMANNGANAFASIYENLNATIPTRPHSITLASPSTRAEWIIDNIVDAQGNIYFAGFTTGNLQGTAKGEGDAFIAKYSLTLTNPKIVQFGTNKSDLISKLEIDNNGIIYATGYTYGNLIGNNQDLSGLTGDIFIQKFNSNLDFLDAKQFGTPHEDRGHSYLLGNTLFIGGMTEGYFTGNNQGSFDGFIMALDKSTLTESELNVTLSIKDEEIVKKTKLNENNEITIYPNPASLVKKIKQLNNTCLDYTIFNMEGRKMHSGKVPDSKIIDISKLPEGSYYIEIKEFLKLTRRKFIIKN